MKGLLLINLGTPDQPTSKAVARYLKQFLTDPLIIDLPPWARWLLVNGMIVPFRSRRSAAQYRSIWQERGSPLLIHSMDLRDAVRKRLEGDYQVEIGMRYGNPSIGSALKKLMETKVSEIRVLPLFPQQASSSGGSAVREVWRELRSIKDPPPIKILPPFYNHPGFIGSFVEVGRPFLKDARPDHVLFSFHGLPMSHVRKRDHAYPHHCRETARLIAEGLGLPQGEYSVTFQSRMGPVRWLVPYTDREIVRLIQSGKKRLLVFAPAFVADCLETLEEVGHRFKRLASDSGVERFELVPSLNAYPVWVQAVCEMAR